MFQKNLCVSILLSDSAELFSAYALTELAGIIITQSMALPRANASTLSGLAGRYVLQFLRHLSIIILLHLSLFTPLVFLASSLYLVSSTITSVMVFKNAISWFEIPATDIDRAQKFYETIFEIEMVPLDLQELTMRLFPVENPMSVGGALCHHAEFYKSSSTDGPLIYLNGNPDVQNILDRIEAAGGKIVVPKTQITPEYGYMAIFIDTEGNRIALHSVPQPE